MPRLDRAIQIQDMLQQLERESKVPVLHPKNYLIYNHRIEMWRAEEKHKAYTANVLDAYLYTEEEARRITLDPGGDEDLVLLEQFREGIERLYHTLNPHEFLPSQ